MAERRDTKNRLLGKGEYQKSDGRYMYRYVDHNGNSRFVYSWTLTQTDRAPKGKHSGKCLRELEKEIAKDLQDKIDTFNADRLTLNDMFDRYMEQKIELKLSTRSNYKCRYNKHIRDSIGRRRISEIKYSDIRKFYNHCLYKQGLGIGSVKLLHIILHPIFEIAVRDEYIRTNPTSNVLNEIKKKGKFEVTEEEQKVFLNFLKSDEKYSFWKPLFTVLLGTGCRIGEVAGLTWDDCDFKNKTINIRRNLVIVPDEVTGKCKHYISTTKTSAGKREIPMFDVVKEALLEERKKQMQIGFNESIIDGCSGFVFSNKNRKVIGSRQVNKIIKQIICKYNFKEVNLAETQRREPILLPHFSVHNLRHTFCTRMCENETNIKIIQDIMGHSDIKTTMDVYNEATRDKKKQSFENLEGKIVLQ